MEESITIDVPETPQDAGSGLEGLWGAVVAEIEHFLENCNNTWDVEWPIYGPGSNSIGSTKLASPTKKIYVRAPKPWVQDDSQTCIELVVHVDVKALRPVCAELLMGHTRYRSMAQVAGHLMLLEEGERLFKALLSIDALSYLPTDFSTPDDLYDEAQDEDNTAEEDAT